MPGDVAQTLASQQEWVRPQLEDLSLVSSTLWKRIEKNTKVQAVSNRPYRVPTMPSQGGKFRVAGLDGSDLGRGSAPVEVPGTGVCVSFVQANEYTALAEYATDSDQKAIENYADLTHRYAAKTFGGYMDALIQGSGANDLDTIQTVPVASGNQVTVNNANLFQNNQDVDIWSAVGGAKLASMTVLTADAVTSTLTFTDNLPGTVVAGNVILVSGSSGQANTGMNGIRTFAVSTNTGMWMNVPRNSYPGMYTTPSIAVGGALTPAIVRELQSLVELAKGLEEEDEETVAHCNVSERNAWENNALLVQRIDYNADKGDRSADMLKKKSPNMIGGREMLVNVRAQPGYIDFLKLSNWFRVETKPLDFYSVAGQTLFPVIGASGGLASSFIFYLVWMGQLNAVQTRENAFLSGISIQAGLFGR
jgi:hypothetical protein